ncbi:MAG: hypothetical protein V4436_02510 [Patescibacteria group bacterium]
MTTIRIGFNDKQTGANMVISNMTTLPYEARSKGFGSAALTLLITWAHRFEHDDIQAVQVQEESESFWIKNDFARIGNVTNDFIYVGP